MAWKKEEKKAKKYIREELAKSDTYYAEPIEQRIEVAKKEFDELIERSRTELETVEKEKELLVKHSILKNRFFTLYVSGEYTQKQIANILGVHPHTISVWLRDEEIKNAIELYQKEEDIIIGTSLKALRMKALNTMNGLLDAENELVALNAAKDVLDRTGHKASEKKEVTINMTYEERLNQLLDGVEVIDVDSVSTQDTQK